MTNRGKTGVGGGKFWPLSPGQIEDFHEAATELNDPKAELTGLTLLYSGLRNAEFHHMRDDWLEYSAQGQLRIVVPKEAICTGGAGQTGKNNADGANLHQRGQPCSRCRASTPNWVSGSDDMWHPKSDAGGGRVIPIPEPDAVDILEWWFETNNAVPMLHKGVNSRIERIAEKAGIERDVTAHDLRDTYGTTLARREFDRWKIKDLLGHSSLDSTEKYIKFVGRELDQAFDEKW